MVIVVSDGQVLSIYPLYVWAHNTSKRDNATCYKPVRWDTRWSNKSQYYHCHHIYLL